MPYLIRKLTEKNLCWRVKTAQKEVFLTFDDGPIPEVTPRVLDILDEYGAKATFFCVGDNVRKYPHLFQEVKKRGHSVGNHTFNHLNGYQTPLDDYLKNVEKANTLVKSDLFRPPYGKMRLSQWQALKKKYRLILWDCLTYDFDKSKKKEEILKLIYKKTRNGTIVVFHDSLKAEKNLFEVLPVALEFWKNRGYRVVAFTDKK